MPLCFIVVCYICIGLKLRVQMAERKTLSEERKCHNVNTKFFLGTVFIVCNFILTWLPYQVLTKKKKQAIFFLFFFIAFIFLGNGTFKSYL